MFSTGVVVRSVPAGSGAEPDDELGVVSLEEQLGRVRRRANHHGEGAHQICNRENTDGAVPQRSDGVDSGVKGGWPWLLLLPPHAVAMSQTRVCGGAQASRSFRIRPSSVR